MAVVVDDQLVKAELKAVKAVEDLFASAMGACCDVGFQKTFTEESAVLSTDNDDSHSCDALQLLEAAYFLPASRQMAVYCRTVLYKSLYKTWKKSHRGSLATCTLVEFSSTLPRDVRRKARSKAQAIMSFLASDQELRTQAQEQVEWILDEVRELSHAYIERKAKHIMSYPSSTGSERDKEILRLEEDTMRYTHRQLLSRLQQNQHVANNHLLAACMVLYREQSRGKGVVGEIQKWSADVWDTVQFCDEPPPPPRHHRGQLPASASPGAADEAC